jgi:hypothetical protein
MAKQSRSTASSSASSNNRFDKGANTDIRDYHLEEQAWTHARNAINNSHIGDLGDLGNEPSNKFCSFAPYTIIGTIHMEGDMWWIYSTNDIDSEIGQFDESTCVYTKIVNNSCLNFKTTHLISGASRPTWDCSHRSYWQDDLNPDRTLDKAAVPWVQECVDSNGSTEGGCITCIDTDVLDCDKMRLEAFIQPMCLRIEKGPSGGSILNGSYYVQAAYVVNSQRVTDYSTMSNIISIFEHDEVNGSLDIIIENLDQNFDEYELVLIQQIAEKLSVKKLGIYSTNQDKVTVDVVDPTLESVRPNDLIITNPIADKSEGVFSVGKYLFRTGITSKFDFNYQPLANQISVKWQTIEYPEDYYKNGGIHIGHMRDEVYPYFVRWVYNTGDKSKSYHIPGRGPKYYNTPDGSGVLFETDDYTNINNNNLEQQQGFTSKVFEMFNTANGSNVNILLPDGGVVTGEGEMGYWESDEFYPDNKPNVWNANIPGHPEWDLCGTPIRHHKMPENTIYSGSGYWTGSNHYVNSAKKIRILGVAFDNIQPPIDNNGVPISNIVGYEILRGSRFGNKSVVYKGLINNMRKYKIPKDLNIGKQGLYPNYPFNDTVDPDAFNSILETSYEPLTGNSGTQAQPNKYQNYLPNAAYSKKDFTFHSPDTMFNKPFLGQKELKIYGAMHGIAEGRYAEVSDHPKHVFVTDVSFYVGLLVGVGLAVTKAVGKRTKTYKAPSLYSSALFVGTTESTGTGPIGSGAIGAPDALFDVPEILNEEALNLVTAITGTDTQQHETGHDLNFVPGSGVTTYGVEITYEDQDQIPTVLRVFQAAYVFGTNVAEGADLTMDLIRNMSKPKQHALQYLGYSGYENFSAPYTSNRRRLIKDADYLSSHLQNYDTNRRINNILRSKTVVFDTTQDVETLIGNLVDNTMYKILASDLPNNNPYDTFIRQASSHYVAFKTRLRSQYGAINSIKQLPASYCTIPYGQTNSGTIFGGDTYIGRYQEKNTFYHFYQWLLDQPDKAEFNYHLYDAVQHTAFWMDTEPFDTMEFTASIDDAIDDAVSSGNVSSFFQGLVTPSDKHCLDRLTNSNGVFTVKKAFIYLFHSSVRDFFVESELNIDHRDHDGTNASRHWDALQDLREMFNARIIKAGNLYKLDRGLSVSYLPFSKLSWGIVQDREYDPDLAETCYTKYPRRLMYSLPQETQLKADNWSAFLANNYKDFTSNVVAIKAIRKTGILLLFEHDAPGMYPGVDELIATSGTSITVGDGGLFARAIQSLSNTDEPHEYGSCQSRRSVINTPAGIFYISQDQGKIFQIGEAIKEISLTNNQHWFNQYLPYQILEDFPNFDLLDNPVVGVGCQSIYDNEWGIIYFCKKDYRIKPEYANITEYIGDGIFLIDKITRVTTGDSRFFNSASWTVSYDPKNGEEISWHDWHPDLVMAGKNSFLTTKGAGIWRHNNRCDSYCNYYGVDYPFEIEFQIDNLPAVTTMRNVEYWMQVFEFEKNCRDRFHVLDFNFDEAVIYNSEQTSGVLRLNLSPKNDVTTLASYPIVGLNEIDILYSKEEQKYRFNQFWDITKDRGEFSISSETIWNTQPNGYIKDLNPLNLNYNKNEFQRKKIRHNNIRILLRRTVSGNKKMLILINTTKLLNSSR